MQELARRYVRYVVAIAACVVALLFQWLIWPYIPPSPQLLFYPAVLVAAWFGGLAPGVLAVMVSSLAIAYWFLLIN